jgi:hypothetical protein
MTFDFEKLYKNYPLKRGKNEGLLICKNTIKTETDFLLLEKAIQTYRDHCIKHNTEPTFIQHFFTFMNKKRWRDWLDPDTGSSIIPSVLDWGSVWGTIDDEISLRKTDESTD